MTKVTDFIIARYGLITPLMRKQAERNGETLDESLPNENEVNLCMEWLNLFAKPCKTISRYSSYFLKHCVEVWCGEYVANGAFIEAVRRMGWDVIPVADDNPNAVFRLSYDRKALRTYAP